MIKSLVLKDLLVMRKQLALILIFVVIFSVIPDYSSSVVMLYAMILPTSTIGYDEQSKWTRLALCMPYSKRDIVLSKYLLSVLSALVFFAISVIASTVASFVTGAQLSVELFSEKGFMALASLSILSLTLPVMLKFGSIKGRMVFIMLIVAIGICISMFSRIAMMVQIPTSAAWLVLPAVIIMLVVSALISFRIYNKKEF